MEGARRAAAAAGEAKPRIETSYLQLILRRLWLSETENGSHILRNVGFAVSGIASRVGVRIVSGNERDEILKTQYRYRRRSGVPVVLIQARQHFPGLLDKIFLDAACVSLAPRPAVGEQPPRIAPLPDTAWSEEAARSDARSTEGFDHHAEPQMPEPPPRPARPSFADEIRRPAPPPMPERRSDPLTGFAPESISGRPEAAPPRLGRNEPLMPRPQRELPKAPPVREPPPAREAPLREASPVREAPPIREALPVRDAPAVRETPARAPERAAAPPPPPPPPAPAPSSADQNLAEMAQRLEAALRRPTEPVAPPVAPETPPARTSRNEPPAPTPAPQKSGFENLEDEMASLLGRPKNPS